MKVTTPPEDSTGGLFGASSFCGFEDPERPGWRCVAAPNHVDLGYPQHVFGKDVQLGTVPREAPDR